jgi:prepilin-type N-terminal cleavage/methylation domain-containing protein
MRLVWKSPLSRQGFTLIEVIITIVIGAILGSLVVSQLGTSLFHSADSVFVVRNEGLAEAWLERIISDYVKELNSANYASVLATIKARDYSAAPYNMPASVTLTRTYVTYDAAGVETTVGGVGTSTNLKVTVQMGENKLTSLLTAERSSGSDPYATY